MALIDTFDGARAVLSGRANWVTDGSNDIEVSGNGDLRHYGNYTGENAAFGPDQVGAQKAVWTVDLTQLMARSSGSQQADGARFGVTLWRTGGDFVLCYFNPPAGRIYFERSIGYNAAGLSFAPLPANFFTTDLVKECVFRLAADGKLRVTINGVLAQTDDGLGNPVAWTADLSNFTGVKGGKVGLRSFTQEDGATGRHIATAFGIPDDEGGTPTPTPGLSNTVGTVPIALPRVPNTTRAVAFTGVATGAVPTKAIYRLYKKVGSAAATLFQDKTEAVSPQITGQTFSGNVPLLANVYNERWLVEWGFETAGGQVSYAAPVPIAIARPVMWYGQSNATFQITPAVPQTHLPGAYVVGNGNPTGLSLRGPDDTNEKPSIVVGANRLAQLLNMPVLAFVAGAPGTGILYMKSGTQAWDSLLANVALIGGKPELVIYNQWENDANTQFDINLYPGRFAELLADFRSYLGATVPVFIAMAGVHNSASAPDNGGTVAEADVRYTNMRIVQEGLVEQRVLIASSSLGIRTKPDDAYHHTPENYQRKQLREMQTVAKYLGIATHDGRGPLPTGATISGTTVTIALTLNGATGVAGSNLTGYQTSANGGSTWVNVAAADASIVGGAVQLRNRPSGTNRVRSFYGMNYDDSSLANGAYANGDSIPVFPINAPMTVTTGGTPTPTPVIPTNQDAPDITGSAVVGSTLSRSDTGDWTNAQSITLQWLRGSTAISGANGASYVTQSADIGQAVRLRERATSSTGDTADALSNTITVTAAPTPTPSPGQGSIGASAARTVRFKEVQAPTARPAGVPYGAELWSAALDPHGSRRFAVDFSDVLGDGVEIDDINSIAVNASGFLLGLRVSTADPPIIGTEGKDIEVRFEVTEARRNDEGFNGSGKQADVTYSIDTTSGDTIENTAILTIRNQ